MEGTRQSAGAVLERDVMKTYRSLNSLFSPGLLLCVLPLTGCSLAGGWVYKEAQRIASPDGQTEAVIVTGDAGAVTRTETYVVITAIHGVVDTKTINKDAAFSGNHMKNFKVVWLKPDLLEIQYDEALIDGFSNLRYVRRSGRLDGVEIRLSPQSSPYSSPAQDRTSVPN